MKKTILTIALLMGIVCAKAQQQPAKQLPPKLTFTLTDREFLKLDSAINIAANSTDSKQLTNFILKGVEPLYRQVQGQMVLVADTAKKSPGKGVKP